MADNVTISDANDIAVPIAADEISGKQHQRVKVQHGADGSATDVSSASPMPVADAALLQAVDGLEGKDYATQATLAAILAKIIAAPATEATLAALLAAVDGLETNTSGIASQVTLAALLADSQAKADLSETQPVSAASLPLPSGASTSAKQDTAQTRLDLLATDAKLELVRALLAGTLTTALDAATLSALETIELGATTLAALESITVVDGGGSLTVDGTVSVNALPAGTANIGDVDVLSLPALPAGTNNIGDVDVLSLPAIPAGTNNIGDVDVLTLPALPTGTNVVGQVGLEPRTSGGLLASRTLSAASTNATSVKGSAGQVYGWYFYNANAAVRYLKLYNKASAPTVGTDTPVMTLAIPAGAAANVELTQGIAFATGIAFALTTGVADSDTAAVAANEIIVNLFYK